LFRLDAADSGDRWAPGLGGLLKSVLRSSR
jgi:hypothetical protein